MAGNTGKEDKVMNKAWKKTLIVSEWGPPMASGGPIMLGRLFKYYPKDSYCILMRKINIKHIRIDPGRWLNCRYFFCPIPQYLGNSRLLHKLYILVEFILIPAIVLKGLAIVRNERIDNILAPSNRGAFLIAAFFISKITSKPLLIYLFDIYEELMRDFVEKCMAKFFERIMFSHAVKIFVMSEYLAAHYLQKYGIQTEVMPHPVDLELYSDRTMLIREKSPEVYKIVYTGMIWTYNLEAIKNLVEVMNSLENGKVELLIFTQNFSKQLAEGGISGRNIVTRFAKAEEIPAIQKDADILFLPFSFNSPYPLLIKNASPSKLPEYLAAGKPILVHAPSDCYVSHYARKNGFGIVVDKLDPEELRRAIILLLEDRDLRERLGKNAIETAKKHDAKLVSRRLQEYLI
jgi:glycosyltransferase involved in cell wall biosynthesis